MSRRRFAIPFIPPQRPKEEWEHVYVTKGGRRFVKIDELLSHDATVERIKEVAALTRVDGQDVTKKAGSSS